MSSIKPLKKFNVKSQKNPVSSKSRPMQHNNGRERAYLPRVSGSLTTVSMYHELLMLTEKQQELTTS